MIDQQNPNKKTKLSPITIIRAELDLREKMGTLNHESSPILIKLTSLYKVRIFDTKPQMFPSTGKSVIETGLLNLDETE